MTRPSALVLLVLLAACARQESAVVAGTANQLFLGGTLVASIEERVAGRVVERTSRLAALDGDVATLRATLDDEGFVTGARYERSGPRGERKTRLVVEPAGAALVDENGRAFPLARGPIVLLDVLHHVKARAKTPVTFVDLASGETLAGYVEAAHDDGIAALDVHGGVLAHAAHHPPSRTGPGRFFEGPPRALVPSELELYPPLEDAPATGDVVALLGIDDLPLAALALDGPGQRASARTVLLDDEISDTGPALPHHSAPAPYLESDDTAVRVFAETWAKSGVASADALALAAAIHELVDTAKGGGPPSAKSTLSRRAGDCDDATALLVAALRAKGYAARPVVGYRYAGSRYVPHAWAEVRARDGWLPVDALVPGLGPFSTHLRLFEGLGSPLTMGRVLGALSIAKVREANTGAAR